jgi:hypothetical protein
MSEITRGATEVSVNCNSFRTLFNRSRAFRRLGKLGFWKKCGTPWSLAPQAETCALEEKAERYGMCYSSWIGGIFVQASGLTEKAVCLKRRGPCGKEKSPCR